MTNSSNEYIKLNIILFVLFLFLFKSLFCGSSTLYFLDIGADTYNAFLPYLLNFYRGNYFWSFEAGLGQNMFNSWLFDPFLCLFKFLPEYYIGKGLIYVFVLKIVLAANIFYFWLRLNRISTFASLFGSISYAFSGQALFLSSWNFPFSTGILVLPALFVATDLYFLKNKIFKLLLPISVAYIAFIGSFYYYYFGIILVIYFFTKMYFAEKTTSFFDFIKQSFVFGVYCVLGLALSSFFWINDLQMMLSSARSSQLLVPSFSFVAIKEIVFIMMRLLSNDIWGANSGFSLPGNTLEMATFYIGVWPLILFIPSFFLMNKKARVFYIMFSCVFCGFICVPSVRLIFNGGVGFYFRQTPLIFCTIIIFICSWCLSKIELSVIKKNLQFKNILVFTFLALLVLFLVFSQTSIYKLTDKKIFWTSCLFVVLTFGALYIYIVSKKRVYKIVLAVIFIAEIVYMNDYSLIKNRLFVNKSNFSNHNYIEDPAFDLIKKIRTVDKSFYRISKNSVYSYLNEGIVEQFYGDKVYSSFIIKTEIDFLDALSARPQNQAVCFLTGISNDRGVLKDFLNFKYDIRINDSRKFLMAERSTFLPLGIVLNSYITREDFLNSNTQEKDELLINSVVVEESDLSNVLGVLNKYKKTQNSYHENKDKYNARITALKENAVKNLEVSNHKIYFDVKLSESSFVVLQFPFDKRWRVEINGKKAIKNLYKVDIGLTGVLLGPGINKVILTYSWI